MNQKMHIYSLLKFTSLAMLISTYSCSSRPLEIDSSEVKNFSNYELCGILEKGRYSESAKSMALREIEKRKYNCAEDFEEIITDNPKGIKMGN
jgi:hypothetical protein